METGRFYVVSDEMLEAREKVSWEFSWVLHRRLWRDDQSCEAEESPLLEAFAREQLVRYSRPKKSSVGAVTICELWRSVMVLQLLVLMNCVYKWSTNPVTNPNTINSHPYTWQYVASRGYHMVITINVTLNRVDKWLKENVGKYTEWVTVMTQRRCGGGQSTDCTPWPQYWYINWN
jgi:hypothetical protein